MRQSFDSTQTIGSAAALGDATRRSSARGCRRSSTSNLNSPSARSTSFADRAAEWSDGVGEELRALVALDDLRRCASRRRGRSCASGRQRPSRRSGRARRRRRGSRASAGEDCRSGRPGRSRPTRAAASALVHSSTATLNPSLGIGPDYLLGSLPSRNVRTPQRRQNEHELIAERKAKLARFREAGIEPFPHEFQGVVPSEEVRENHPGLEPGTETNVTYRVAGRLSGRRGHGKAAFLDVDRPQRQDAGARARRSARRRIFRAARLAGPRRPGRDRRRRLRDQARRAVAGRDRVDAAGQVAAPAAGQAPRPRRRRDALPPPRARPDRQRRGARAVHPALDA